MLGHSSQLVQMMVLVTQSGGHRTCLFSQYLTLTLPSVALVLCRVTRCLWLEALRDHQKMVHEQLHQLSCSPGKLYSVCSLSAGISY